MNNKIKTITVIGAILAVLIVVLFLLFFMLLNANVFFGGYQALLFSMFILTVFLAIDLIAGAYYVKNTAIRVILIIIALIVAFFALMLLFLSMMVFCEPGISACIPAL